jgi:2,3-bisphosphoglycerate-dependent phosphoglycerate mutase
MVATSEVSPQRRWPVRLWLVRHGESAGNVARDAANAAQADRINILAGRDVDVPLSALGIQQAHALGKWFATQPSPLRPEVILVSPYLRAQKTVGIMLDASGISSSDICQRIDERFREREFGILDRLTQSGIRNLHPDQAQFRAQIGKFYHRPPGGESWCDVILRLRSALDTLSLHHSGKRVLIVAHEVVVLCLRYLLEEMTEAEILRIDALGDVANCAITEYGFDEVEGCLKLVRYNDISHLQQTNAPITTRSDVPVAPR